MSKDKILKLIHPVVLKILSSRRKFDLIVDGKIPDEQSIFIANHYCIHDIPTAGEVIKKHTFILVSDEDKYTTDGLALSLNGVIWINRLNKDDRKRANNDILAHLKKGHNILMYPEATWNLTAELPMLPMNWGVVGISLESGVPIVPMYLLFTEKTCYVKIGKPFTPSSDKQESIAKLRDIMATLCFALMEKLPITKRSELPDDYLKNSIRDRYNEYGRARKDPSGVRQYESQFIFKPKGVTEPAEAFAHLKVLTPTRNNAFLFNKRWKG